MRINEKGVPANIVIITVAMLFVVGWLLTSTAIVSAHSASTYYVKKWSSDPIYSLGKLDSPLNTSTAKSSIHSGDDEWDFTSGAWLDFNWNFGEDSTVVWLGGACTTVPQSGWLWILTDNISSLGVTSWCTTSTTITKSTIRLDDVGTTWYTGSSSSVPSGQYDLRSVITHEFGHAGGFGVSSGPDHFTGSSICSGTTRQTMCSGLPTGTSYKRTLESHDEHTFASAY